MTGKKDDKSDKRLMSRTASEKLTRAKESAQKYLTLKDIDVSADKHGEVLEVDDEVDVHIPDGTHLGIGQYIGKAMLDGYVVVTWEEDGALFVGNWPTSFISKAKT